MRYALIGTLVACSKDAVYVSPFYRLWNVSATVITDLGNTGTGSLVAHQLGETVGYLWQWDHFSTNVGLGYSVLHIDNIKVKDDLGNQSEESFGGASSGGYSG